MHKGAITIVYYKVDGEFLQQNNVRYRDAEDHIEAGPGYAYCRLLSSTALHVMSVISAGHKRCQTQRPTNVCALIAKEPLQLLLMLFLNRILLQEVQIHIVQCFDVTA